jgi:hypothetical protein
LGELAGSEERLAEIRARLLEVDAASIRAMRAINRGRAVQADEDRLAALDAEADELRAEQLAILGQTG